MPELVSIIIVNYNYGRYLPEAIESALNQTWPAIEVIYNDDGSTDNSLEIAQRYPITVLSQENQGLPTVRNNAVEFANGNYLFFLDSDDIFFPTTIEHCMKAIADAPPEVGYVYGQMEYFEYKQGRFDSRKFSSRELARNNYICAASLVRRDVFLHVGGYDRGMVERWEDWEFYIRLYHHGVYGRFLAEPLIRCRKHKPPIKKFINTKKKLAQAKLIYKYPKFFWRTLCKRPFKYLSFLLFGDLGSIVHKYGPSLDKPARRVK